MTCDCSNVRYSFVVGTLVKSETANHSPSRRHATESHCRCSAVAHMEHFPRFIAFIFALLSDFRVVCMIKKSFFKCNLTEIFLFAKVSVTIKVLGV